MPARWREQPAAIALEGDGGEIVLEGLYTPGPWPGADEPESGVGWGAVVAPPHPLYGGSMESPVVGELAFRCHQRGVATLRFNWRGVGASGGDISGEASDAIEDYRGALDFVEESVEGPLLACGYSFGAATALAAAASRPRVERLLLVAPPAAMLDEALLASFPGSVFIAAGDRDELAQSAQVEALCAELENAHFSWLEETDHFFGGGTAGLGRVVERWLP